MHVFICEVLSCTRLFSFSVLSCSVLLCQLSRGARNCREPRTAFDDVKWAGRSTRDVVSHRGGGCFDALVPACRTGFCSAAGCCFCARFLSFQQPPPAPQPMRPSYARLRADVRPRARHAALSLAMSTAEVRKKKLKCWRLLSCSFTIYCIQGYLMAGRTPPYRPHASLTCCISRLHPPLHVHLRPVVCFLSLTDGIRWRRDRGGKRQLSFTVTCAEATDTNPPPPAVRAPPTCDPLGCNIHESRDGAPLHPVLLFFVPSAAARRVTMFGSTGRGG